MPIALFKLPFFAAKVFNIFRVLGKEVYHA
jgi:hypothetical protein